MDLRQLEYLLAVIDEGTFTRASARLHIAQSAVSHHVAVLESELNVLLLRRVRPTVLPTPAGEVFAARARRILAEVASARAEIASLSGQTVGDVAFGATIPAATLDIAQIIAAFRRSYPGVRVRLREGTGPELTDMIRDDTIDLAVVSTDPILLARGLTGVVVDNDDLILAGPNGHPLSRHKRISVDLLDGVELISFRQGAGLRSAADVVLQEAGVTPNVVIESNEMPVLLGLVAHGLGVAILPRAFVDQTQLPIWSRPLEPAIRPPLTLVWREHRRRPPAVDAFLRHLLANAPRADAIEAARDRLPSQTPDQ
jgi:LysR family transcriptional regulator, transcription activator of glutamate synthase operon